MAFVKELSASLKKLDQLKVKLLKSVKSKDVLKISNEIELLIHELEDLNVLSGTEISDLVVSIRDEGLSIRASCTLLSSTIISGIGSYSERKKNLYHSLDAFLKRNKIPDYYKKIV